MKKKYIGVITAFLLLFLLAGCERAKLATETNVQREGLVSYGVENLPKDTGMRVKGETLLMPEIGIRLYDAVSAGDDIYLSGYDAERHPVLYSLKRDTCSIQRIFNSMPEEMTSVSATYDGALWVLSLTEDGKYLLLSMSPDGKSKEIELDSSLYQDDIIYDFEATDKGFLIKTSSKIIAIDADGKQINEFKSSSETEIVKLSPEKTLLIFWGGTQYAKNALSEPSKISELDRDFNVLNNYYTDIKFSGFFSGLDGKLMARLGNTLYEYDYASGKCVSLVNLFSSGVQTFGLQALTNDTYFTIQDGLPTVWHTTNANEELCTLSLATYNMSLELRRAIEFFNSSNNFFRIEPNDYAVYDSYGDNKGLDLMARDIISGNAPDIYDLSSFDSKQLAEKGLLEDLKPFFDASNKVSYQDIIPNIEELLEYEDGLYEIVPAFYLVTMCADKHFIGSDWSIQRFISLGEQYSMAELLGPEMTKRDFLGYVISFMKADLYSEESGKCNFDSDTFISMLTMAAKLPSEVILDGSEGTAVGRAAAGEQRLILDQFDRLIVSQIAWYDTVFNGNAEFVGFPTDTGTGFGMYPCARLGMSASSQNKAGVWDFFELLLSADTQVNSRVFLAIPILSEAMDTCLDAWVARAEEKNPGVMTTSMSGEIEISSNVNGTTMKPRMQEMLTKIDNIAICNNSILDIVMDCSSAFFAGDKTAEDIAEIIQSRVSLYLSEQYT